VSRKEDTKKYGEMAVRLADRIDERERYLFLKDFFGSGRLDSVRLNSRKVIQAYERLGKNYPFDSTMTGLSGLYTGREDWDKALPILEKLTLRHKNSSSVVQNLAACYQSLGHYDKAEKLLDDYMNANPAPGTNMMFVLERRLRLALVQAKFDAAHDCAVRSLVEGFHLPHAG
jgi:tetratricopeptide (TPR) repeat protein